MRKPRSRPAQACCEPGAGHEVHASSIPFSDPSGDRLREMDGDVDGPVLRIPECGTMMARSAEMDALRRV